MLDNAAWEAYAKGSITLDTAQLDILRDDIEYVGSPRFGEKLEIQTWLDPFPSPGQECNQAPADHARGKSGGTRLLALVVESGGAKKMVA
jgi:hypothetical protein